MDRYEKNHPLIVLEVIEIVKSLAGDTVVFEFTPKSLIRFKDADPKSNFYFVVSGYTKGKNGLTYSVQYKPHSRSSIEPANQELTTEQVKPYIVNWINFLKEYNKRRVFEDPILKQYEEEFQTIFVINDSDADVASFNTKSQLALDNFLTEIYAVTEKINDSSNEIKLLQAEITNLKETQTSLTKKKVMERMARIFAMARKKSISLVKELGELMKKEIAKQLVSGGGELLKDLLNP